MQRAAVALACALAALVAAGLVSAAGGAPGGYIPSKAECRIDRQAPNVNLDCPTQKFPVGEPHVAVDPSDPNHIVVTAMNDATCCIQYSTSFDAGKSWTTGSMSAPKPPANLSGTMADTSVAFDPRHDTVVHVALTALVKKSGEVGEFDVVANVSNNGGRSWDGRS
jgi:hypothetical protein